ncbi:MAG: hypothetical protein CSA68_08755 [Rhodobacterales bacterium]|nr:MAG: hypothetical protein CSA68_08755 [Rhodobacterales bacterium]
MMRISSIALTLLASATAASADVSLSIPLAADATSSVTSEIYSCDGAEPFVVQYINSGPNTLAIVPIKGEMRIFVNVVSASGAKYASGEYVWWTKGKTAMLENEMDKDSHQNCVSE